MSGQNRLPIWQIGTIWLLRLLIGGLFVMSGFVKMVDPWGFIFKIEEYLAVWHFTEPRTVVLMAVLMISGYEFVMGALLAMGCYKRVAPWGLLLMMGVMLPLTLYIWIENPVSDCGCFGDFWILSNAATFWKNVAITAALVFLACRNNRLRQGFFEPSIQWMTGAWISLYILLVGLYGYNIQPLMDFRSYPVGTGLARADEDVEDDTHYRFLYEKDGEKRDFSIDELPDSTWNFVDRIYIGNEALADGSTSLAIFDGDEEVTSEVLNASGDEILLIIPEPVRADISYTFTVNEMYEYADSLGIPVVALLGGDRRAVDRWRDIAMAEYPCYSADDTQLKELARGTLSVVTLRDGVVTSKNAVGMLTPGVIEAPETPERFMEEIRGYSDGKLFMLNLIFGGGLLLLYACQGIILGIRFGIRKWLSSRKGHPVSQEGKSSITEAVQNSTKRDGDIGEV